VENVVNLTAGDLLFVLLFIFVHSGVRIGVRILLEHKLRLQV